MPLADALLTEYEAEYQTTRLYLQALPAGRLDWSPHAKSLTLGQLALHIAAAPRTIVELACDDVAQFPAPGGGFPQPDDKQQILDAGEASLLAVRATLPTFDKAAMSARWCAERNGTRFLDMPRAAFLRAILLNHIVHHRGQLNVYLRLLDVPVPSTYGPSADVVPEVFQDDAVAG